MPPRNVNDDDDIDKKEEPESLSSDPTKDFPAQEKKKGLSKDQRIIPSDNAHLGSQNNNDMVRSMETSALLLPPPPTTTPPTTSSSKASSKKNNITFPSWEGPYSCWMTEARLFFELAIPIIILYGSFIICPILTSSIVGRKLGTTYLSAFALASMTSNLCTFSITCGLFSAADTLMPQSFGVKNYREVGLIAIRGIVVCCVVLIPINIVLVLYLKEILIALGEDVEASILAQQWYRIFVFSLPFMIIVWTCEKFLSAQSVMRPLVTSTVISCYVILPIALELLIGTFGFLGSAVAYVLYQAVDATILLLYLNYYQPHVAETWPGLGAWREALQHREKMMEYIHLGTGGIVVQSEWIYWEAVTLIIGRLGVIPLSAHTIPNNVLMAICQIPFAFGQALTIRMGNKISDSVKYAKNIAIVTLVVTIILFVFISVLLYTMAEPVITIFTTDIEVIELSESVWRKVCIYNWLVAIFAILSGISNALGMQWIFGAINCFFMWIVGIPILLYFLLVQGGGLSIAWTCINASYVGIILALFIAIFSFSDWNLVRNKILRESSTTATSPSSNLELEEEGQQSYQRTSSSNLTDDKTSERKGLLMNGGSKEPRIEYGGV